MNIAELFINLGIKGSEKTVGALSNVKKGLGEVSSMSLEAKAAIVGAVYALERLMSNSAKVGTGLSNFAALTGLSTQSLQQWQFAARQAGVSSEELTGSLKAVQTGMTNMLMGKGAPEGLGLLANKVGFDPKKARDTFYVMEQLQKFAKTVPADVGNTVLKSFGLSEGTIAAMRKNVFRPEILKKAPTYSEGEIGGLNKTQVAMSNLSEKFEMAIGRMTSKHGLSIIKDIDQLSTSLLKLISSFTILAEKLKIFQVFGKVFEGWGLIFDGITKGAQALTGGKDEKGKEWKGLKKDPVTMLSDWVGDKISGPPTGLPPSTTKNQTVNVNQNLNFQHDGKDHKKTGDSVKKAIQDSYRQMAAQTQGS